MRNFLNFLVITFFVFSIFIGCETKETTKITVLSINNINCLNWEIGTHESDIVQNGWEKTISPNGVTKYDAEYYAEDATLYYHLYFVNKRLGHIHITLLGFTQTPRQLWSMFLKPVYDRFGEPVTRQGSIKCWNLPHVFILGHYDNDSVWMSITSQDKNVFKPIHKTFSR